MMLPLEDCVVKVPTWNEIAWLRHGFGTRRGGVSMVYQNDDLNTGWTAADDPANVVENRRRLMASLGADEAALITVRQVHSAKTRVVQPGAAGFVTAEGKAALEADGLMTRVPGILLGIQTADCVPVLVADLRLRVVAAFHAGWRGTVVGIVEKGIRQMEAVYSSRPEDLVAAVGPSIGACCYSIGDEVREAFASAFSYAPDLFQARATLAGEKVYLDLWEANRRQLIATGVAASRIAIVGECSGCAGLPHRRKYFSHRCENGFTGRMMSLIGVAAS